MNSLRRSCGVLGAVTAWFILAAASPRSDLRVDFAKEKLTVRARAAPAGELFTAVAEKTGVRFVIDSEIKLGTITIDLEGMDLERAIRNLVNEVREAAGHTMAYERGADGKPRLHQVSLFGPGKTPAGATVYEAPAGTDSNTGGFAIPTPDLQDRMDKMVQAGVPRETAEKVMELTQEVQKLQATPAPGSYTAADLSEPSRQQLQPLIDRGVPLERAVQMLLLQERYQDTLKDLAKMPGAPPLYSTSPAAQLVNPGSGPRSDEPPQ